MPMPAPFAGGAPTAVPAVPAAPASAPASATASAIPSGAATPEPPVFGGPDFNPEEWAVPTDWKPPTAAAAVAAAAPAPALAAKPAAGKAAGEEKAFQFLEEEEEEEERCAVLPNTYACDARFFPLRLKQFMPALPAPGPQPSPACRFGRPTAAAASSFRCTRKKYKESLCIRRCASGCRAARAPCRSRRIGLLLDALEERGSSTPTATRSDNQQGLRPGCSADDLKSYFSR